MTSSRLKFAFLLLASTCALVSASLARASGLSNQELAKAKAIISQAAPLLTGSDAPLKQDLLRVLQADDSGLTVHAESLTCKVSGASTQSCSIFIRSIYREGESDQAEVNYDLSVEGQLDSSGALVVTKAKILNYAG